MRESITRVIRAGGIRLYTGKYEHIPKSYIEDVLGKTPERKYRVTYTLNPRGKYTVIGCAIMAGIQIGSKSVAVCFLPESWIGKRVSRKVEVL